MVTNHVLSIYEPFTLISTYIPMLVIPRNRHPPSDMSFIQSLRYCKRSPVAWPRAGTRFSYLILSDKPLEIDLIWVNNMIPIIWV